jgi:hypothetical protein
MTKSRYDDLIVRKPAIFGDNGKEIFTDKIDRTGLTDTGSLTLYSGQIKKGADFIFEYAIISGESFVGRARKMNPKAGSDWPPHKHDDYEEIFCFLGTDKNNPVDLGAEIEWWLGEDDKLDTLKFNTSSAVHIPKGLAHFPLRITKVRRPFFLIVCMPGTGFRTGVEKPVSHVGRPMAD